jgi:competence protein ComEC
VTGRVAVFWPHWLAGALCVGLAASNALRPAPLITGSAAVASMLLAAIARSGLHRLVLVGAALALGGLAWGSARLTALDSSVLRLEIGRTEPAAVVVTGAPRRSRYSVRVLAEVRRFGTLEVDEPVLLQLPSGRSPPQGAVLELVGTLRAPRGPADGFDERAWLRRQGVHAVLRASGWRQVGARGGLGGFADSIRRRVDRSLAPGLDGERRAVLAGIVLGEDEGLSESLRISFRASGLYHLLAVSGQNVGLVAGSVLLLAWLAGLSRAVGEVGALVAIVGYVLAVGLQPSVVRAGIAGALASLAWLVARERDRWWFLLVGATCLLAWNPYTLLEPGFQLSFAAVIAIFTLVPRLLRWLEGYPVPRPLAAVFAVSIACGLATAPIVWLHFRAIPTYSVLGNALAAPVVAPLLWLALASVALDQVLPDAAVALGWVNGWLAAYLATCARIVGGLPGAQVSSLAALGLVATVAAGVVAAVRFPGWRCGLAVTFAAALPVALVGCSVWPRPTLPPPPTGLRMSFLDVGQGDSVLLQAPRGAVLVDQGPPEARVDRQLAGLGVTSISLLVLTHPQRDHVGGADLVLARHQVDAVLDPRLPAQSSDEREALVEAREHGVRVVTARAGMAFRLGKLRLRVLWPDGPGLPGDDPNRHAVVILASYGEVDALLTADAESDVLAPLHTPSVEILKVSHHGSADPGLPDLLRTLRPRVAVISVGRDNDYGHPTPSTLSTLTAAPGLEVFRTDLDGRVVVETDGRAVTVHEER